MRGSSRPVVLVVDDGKQHITLLRLALMQRGYAVIVVHSAEGALSMTRSRSVDALIVTLDSATSVLASLGDARPHVAIAIAKVADDPSLAPFDVVLTRPVDFADLDVMLRERMKLRTSGTRTRVKKRVAS